MQQSRWFREGYSARSAWVPSDGPQVSPYSERSPKDLIWWEGWRAADKPL